MYFNLPSLTSGAGKENAAPRQRDHLRRKEIGMMAKCKGAEGSGGMEAAWGC